MAFDKTLMSKVSSSLTERKVAVVWAYGPSPDDIATITASAFFDEVTNQVTKADLIYIAASDGNILRAFASNTGATPVTIAALTA